MKLKRSTISAGLSVLFLIVSATGLYLLLAGYGDVIMLLHWTIGLMLVFFVVGHIANNLMPLRMHWKRKSSWIVLVACVIVVIGAGFRLPPFEVIQTQYARYKTGTGSDNSPVTTVYKLSDTSNLSIDIKAGQHHWFTQMAVWLEDVEGRFVRTIFVTNSTAKGQFYGGRTKANFKSFDGKMQGSAYRRVDALPRWSHQRGIQASDGGYAPSVEQSLADAISGATPQGDLRLLAQTTDTSELVLFLELNVAFDDNAYYSVYDFPDDSLYHGGTGLLGQPSVVYKTTLPGSGSTLLEYAGFTHPTADDGLIHSGTKGLTTALEIIDYAIVVTQKTTEVN